MIAVWFQDRTRQYRSFVTSYGLEKEVWVIPALLLMIPCRLRPMLLLVISQKPWNKFCSSPPNIEFDRRNAPA
jgi:hypothetical protein